MIFNKLFIYANKLSSLGKNVDKVSSNTFIQTRFFSRVILPTLGNMEQVAEIEKFISLFQYQTLNLLKLTPLYKTLKVARLVMANKVVLNNININFLAVNTQK